MDDPHDLQGFVDAQDAGYARVCDERRHAHKRSHWMWLVFPQMSSFYKNRRLPFIHHGSIHCRRFPKYLRALHLF